MKLLKIYFKLNKNLRIAIAITLLVVLWFVTGIFSSDKEIMKKTKLKEPKVFVQKIQSKNYKEIIDLVGRTDVAQKVDVVSEVSGKVSKIYYKQGDIVEKDALLLEIENDYIQNRLKSAKENLAAKELKLNIAKDLAKSAYKAKTDLAESQANYAKALSEYVDIKRDYENSFVNTPISGFVESKNVDLGDYVAKDSVLYRIISQDELLLVGYLSQSQMDKVKLKDKVSGELTNGKVVEGYVSYVSHQGDEKTKTYKLEVTVDAKEQNFDVKSGRTVNIKIPVGDIPVYEVPHSSLVISDDGDLGIRIVDKNNIVQFKEAELIKDTNDTVMIKIDGSEELNIITRGQLDVSKGMKVKTSYSDSKTKA